jgi:hypothetical protein
MSGCRFFFLNLWHLNLTENVLAGDLSSNHGTVLVIVGISSNVSSHKSQTTAFQKEISLQQHRFK